MNNRFTTSVINILGLCVIIAAVSIWFVRHDEWMGLILIALGILCLVSLIPFGVRVRSTLPDIYFGIIDNGILAVMAVFGGRFGGVAGAILGGVVGNAITDGIAGIFEGYSAETLEKVDGPSRRTVLKSAVGKMAGCLLSAGAVLLVASFF